MRKTLLSLAAATCVVPALAFAAADPRPDSNFRYCKTENNCPLSFNTNPAGTKLTDLRMYAKCSDIPVGNKGSYPPVPVNEGRFSKEGKIENLVGETITYQIQGRFKRPKKAVGTYKLTTKDCNDQKRDFVARRTGPAL